ncbi:unnamed protein product [Rotaria magnacalcarata]|uniref:Uncharacterized protein n=2 Tax=Rotaria magnacalcarata TaxID=392030 RepID=A0A8S2MMH0_9BILA|nr:unnamed protein product [Rotaria magnacalcarata]CAF3966127.1 unnamed protein product [Rotaria magnacalcarata]CAF3992162.1 unnamed protein product [Rotaria magnacalcarata]
MRNKRIRGTILLIGSEEQCTQSVQIIERTKQAVEEISTQDSVADPVNDEDEEIGALDEDLEKNSDDVCEENGDDGSEESSEDDENVVIAERRIEKQAKTKEGSSSMQRSKTKEIESTNSNRSPLSVITNTNDHSSCLSTESSITVKRKGSPNDLSNTFPSNNKKIKHVGYVSIRDHSKIVSQLAAAEEENLVYQTTWMPRPVDKATLQYFIYIGKVLSNDPSVSENEANEAVNKTELIEKICSTLGITESELAKCAGKTILSTARRVISKKYPNSSTVFADVDKDHIQAAADMSARPSRWTKWRENRRLDYAIQLGGKLFQPEFTTEEVDIDMQNVGVNENQSNNADDISNDQENLITNNMWDEEDS